MVWEDVFPSLEAGGERGLERPRRFGGPREHHSFLPQQPHPTAHTVLWKLCNSLSHWELFGLCLNSVKQGYKGFTLDLKV